MPRVTPLTKDDVPELAEGFANMEAILGFVPNSNLIMARRPEILKTFQALAAAVFAAPGLPPDLKVMIGYMTSRSAGCSYCQAHTAHMVEHRGVAPEKLDAIWDYERSDLFTDAERAALAVAQSAGQVPNGVTDADFDELKRHWDEDQVVEIISVISLYGFLNRWNDTLATELEAPPLSFGQNRLAAGGWDAGKHAAD
jgi:uncharacterized peroxidase-related enzyme